MEILNGGMRVRGAVATEAMAVLDCPQSSSAGSKRTNRLTAVQDRTRRGM